MLLYNSLCDFLFIPSWAIAKPLTSFFESIIIKAY